MDSTIAIIIGIGVLLLLAARSRDEADPEGETPPDTGADDKTLKDLEEEAEELAKAGGPLFQARKTQLEAEILRLTGQRISLSGCKDEKGNLLSDFLQAGGNIPVLLTKPKETVCSIETLDNEYLLVLAALNQWNQPLPPAQGQPKPSHPPKFTAGQTVTRREIPRTSFFVGQLRWNDLAQQWEYRDGIGVWHLENSLTGEDLSHPEPSGPTPFQEGDRVIVATNLGNRAGTVTGVRWDAERNVHRYAVRRDDGSTLEYSVSQLTHVVEPPADHPLRPPQGLPRFGVGDRVKSTSGIVGIIADFKYNFDVGTWQYQLEDRPHSWFQQSLLTLV